MAEQPNQNVFGLLTENPNRIYVIAEAGLNHGGNKERALALIRAAKWAGADAVKLQVFRADRLVSTRSARLSHTRGQRDVQEFLKKLELPLDAFKAIYKEANRIGIEFLTT